MHKMMSFGWLAGAAFLLAASVAPAQESYVLAVKSEGFPQAPGTRITKESITEIQAAKMTIIAQAPRKKDDPSAPQAEPETKEGTMTRKETRAEKLEVLSPTKARRTMDAVKVEGSLFLEGQERPIPQGPSPLEKVPMIVEYKDGKYQVSLEAGEPTAAQTRLLEQFAKMHGNDSDISVYGTEPRKPGDKWNVDPKTARFMGEADEISGSYKVEFVEVKEFQGTPCAVLKSAIDITAKSKAGKVIYKGTATTIRSLADKIDLEVKIEATMVMDTQQSAQVSTHVVGPFVSTQTVKVEKP